MGQCLEICKSYKASPSNRTLFMGMSQELSIEVVICPMLKIGYKSFQGRMPQFSRALFFRVYSLVRSWQKSRTHFINLGAYNLLEIATDLIWNNLNLKRSPICCVYTNKKFCESQSKRIRRAESPPKFHINNKIRR